MAKFKYIGDCASGVVKPFGIEFVAGKTVEVKDEHVIGKLRGNSEFKEVKKTTKAVSTDGDSSGNSGQSGLETGDQDSGTSA